MIDAADGPRFGEAKEELVGLVQDEMLADCPILILANKIDHRDAISEDELRQYFELKFITTGNVQ